MKILIIGRPPFTQTAFDVLMEGANRKNKIEFIVKSENELLDIRDYNDLEAVIFTSFAAFDKHQLTEELIRLKNSKISTIIITGYNDLEGLKKSFEWALVIDKSKLLESRKEILLFIYNRKYTEMFTSEKQKKSELTQEEIDEYLQLDKAPEDREDSKCYFVSIKTLTGIKNIYATFSKGFFPQSILDVTGGTIISAIDIPESHFEIAVSLKNVSHIKTTTSSSAAPEYPRQWFSIYQVKSQTRGIADNLMSFAQVAAFVAVVWFAATGAITIFVGNKMMQAMQENSANATQLQSKLLAEQVKANVSFSKKLDEIDAKLKK